MAKDYVGSKKYKAAAAYAENVETHPFNQVMEFHKKFDLLVQDHYADPGVEIMELRYNLIEEEWTEFQLAFEDDNEIEILDALCDMVYVIYGMAISMGLPINEAMKEVHRSNMTKIWPDGNYRKREDGKILKPPTYSPANLSGVIEAQLNAASDKYIDSATKDDQD